MYSTDNASSSIIEPSKASDDAAVALPSHPVERRKRNASNQQILKCELVVSPSNNVIGPISEAEEENKIGHYPNLDEATLKRRLEVRRVCKGNGGRPRDVWTEIDPEMCKDDNGEWTKFVPARLIPEELVAFEQLYELCKTDPTTDWLSDNHKIRYLRGWAWDPQKAFENLIIAEELRASYEPDKITLEEIRICTNWNVYAKLGYDVVGRPVVYAKLRNINMAEGNVQLCAKYMIHLFDLVCAKIPPNCD